jgi:hypothetical protein
MSGAIRGGEPRPLCCPVVPAESAASVMAAAPIKRMGDAGAAPSARSR